MEKALNPKQSASNKKPNSDDSITIVLGGQTIVLRDLNVEEGIELCLLVGPYLPGIFKAIQELSTSTSPEIKAGILRALVQGATSFPGDLMRIIGLFGRRRPKWISQNSTGVESLDALGVIIGLPEFGAVLRMGSRLGLIEKADSEGDLDGRRD
jgi:hypothetical protein